MYTQRCISAGSVAARSACDLVRLVASPYLSPCTLAKPKDRSGNGVADPVNIIASCKASVAAACAAISPVDGTGRGTGPRTSSPSVS